MKDGSGGALRLFERSGLRRAAALYLLIFLAAVAFARHRHLNSFEDLVTDGHSDSGIFLEAPRPDPSGEPQWSSAHFIDDDPCLACFHNDWATEPIAFLVLSPGFHPVCLVPTKTESLVLPVLARSGRSRSPPASA